MRPVRMYRLVYLLLALVSSYALNRYFPVQTFVPDMIR